MPGGPKAAPNGVSAAIATAGCTEAVFARSGALRGSSPTVGRPGRRSRPTRRRSTPRPTRAEPADHRDDRPDVGHERHQLGDQAKEKRPGNACGVKCPSRSPTTAMDASRPLSRLRRASARRFRNRGRPRGPPAFRLPPSATTNRLAKPAPSAMPPLRGGARSRKRSSNACRELHTPARPTPGRGAKRRRFGMGRAASPSLQVCIRVR